VDDAVAVALEGEAEGVVILVVLAAAGVGAGLGVGGEVPGLAAFQVEAAAGHDIKMSANGAGFN
jgi:hypothetical protein